MPSSQRWKFEYMGGIYSNPIILAQLQILKKYLPNVVKKSLPNIWDCMLNELPVKTGRMKPHML